MSRGGSKLRALVPCTIGSLESYIPNLGLLLCLEPSKKFSVGGGGVESDFSVLLWAKALFLA